MNININTYVAFGNIKDNIRDDKSLSTKVQSGQIQKDTVQIGTEIKSADNKNEGFFAKFFPSLKKSIFGNLKNKEVRTKETKQNVKAFYNLPSIQEIDEAIAKCAENYPLDYGFNKDINSADIIKAKIINLFSPIIAKKADTVSQIAQENDKARHLLSIISGSNFQDDEIKSIKTPMNEFKLECIMKNFSNKNSTEHLEDFMKLMLKTSENTPNQKGLIETILINYNGEYQNASKLIAFLDLLNNRIETNKFEGFSANFILKQNPACDFENAYAFMHLLKKSDAYKDNDSFYIDIQRILGDKNLDLKMFMGYYEQFSDNVLKQITLSDIRGIILSPDIEAEQAIEKLNSFSSNTMENVKACGVVNYLKFENLAGKKDLDELSTTEKRELMNKLVQINPYTLGKTSEIFPLLPKNKTEYCTLLEKLSKSLADSNSKTLTKEELQTFKKGLMGLQESVKNIDIDTLELSLEIPKQTFIEQVNHILSDLSDAKRKTVTNFYGFEIADDKLIGYPAIPTNDEISAKEDEKTKDAIKNLRQIVIDFSTNNKIKTNLKDNNFEQHLNETITGLAELRTIIGKIQHPTASYSLDKHTLKVLQGVVKNPKFDALSNKDKNALIIAALLHDIGKMQNQQEGSNPKKPTNNIFNIIQKLNLSEEEQQKIYSLVKNQEWFAMMNNPQNTKEDIQNLAQDTAFELRQSNTFELAKILCEASMKAADKNNSFYKTFKTKFHKMGQIIENYIKSLRKTQIILPQTTVPKASEMKNATIKRADGITNKVIYMDSANNNLCIYGFSPDTTKENFSAIVHALSYEEQLKKLDTITIMDEDALLSTSYIDCKNHETFKNHGLILDVNSNNIHAGNYYDFGTGYSKSIEMLKFSYLFYGLRKEHCTDKMTLKGDKTKHRNYIPNLIKQKMNIDDNTYALLIDKLQNCKSISDIEKISPEFAKAFIEAFDEIKQLQKGSRMKYNEILVSKPKIQAVFARDEAFEDIPVFLRKYAQDNDLPIIMFESKN